MVDRHFCNGQAGMVFKRFKPAETVLPVAPASTVSQMLNINQIVAVPAPCILHHGALRRVGFKQSGRYRKTFRTRCNTALGIVYNTRLPHNCCSSIRPAVASAQPTTPGIPAPGWVPAPTIFELEMTESRLCGLNNTLCVKTGSRKKC